MANAKIDENNEKTALATSNADGSTPRKLTADPTSHLLDTDDNTTGSDLSSPNARRDQNSEPVFMAASNADGKTPVALYFDPTLGTAGKLLIKST